MVGRKNDSISRLKFERECARIHSAVVKSRRLNSRQWQLLSAPWRVRYFTRSANGEELGEERERKKVVKTRRTRAKFCRTILYFLLFLFHFTRFPGTRVTEQSIARIIGASFSPRFTRNRRTHFRTGGMQRNIDEIL